MGRCGYTDDGEPWDFIKWRGQVASSLRGKRGQAFLMELLDALEEMPEKKLIADDLRSETGGVCALGAVGARRGVDLESLDPYDYDNLSGVFGVSHQMVQEIEYVNDRYRGSSPEERWQIVHEWAMQQLRPVPLEQPK